MKYFNIAFIAIVLIGSTLVSCESSSADRIKTEDLETACDHVNALDELATEMLDVKGMDEVKDLKGETKTKYDKLMNKVSEVEKAMQKKYKMKEVKKCPDFDIVRRKFDDLD